MQEVKDTFRSIMQQRWDGKITQDEVKKTYTGKFTTQELVTALEDVLKEKNAAAAEDIFAAGFDLSLFNADTAPVLCKYITETWHKQHENIASLLHTFKVPGTEQALADGMYIQCDYWYDGGDAFIRKCAHALTAIGTPAAHDLLKKLAGDANETIKKYALHQLEKQ
jgi:glycogen synthase